MARKVRISLATKFALTFAALFIVTMLAVTYAVRETIVSRFTEEYKIDVESGLRSIELELTSRHTTIKQQLHQLAMKIQNDRDFRLQALVKNNIHDAYIIDYAKTYMHTMGLQALEITNVQGVVLSSGHNRSAFGREVITLIRNYLTLEEKLALSWFKSTSGNFLCLMAIEPFTLGTQQFFLVGGVEINSSFLSDLQGDTTEIVLLQLPNEVYSSLIGQDINQAFLKSENSDTTQIALSALKDGQQYSIGEISLPLLTESKIKKATLYHLHPKTQLTQLLADLNQRIFIIIGIGLIVAILISIWRTRAVTKPLRRLAATASNLSLDKLDLDFQTKSNDEVGVLNDALRNMLARLRRNRLKLTLAEQKAALADLARQINHDIKNAFTPIRHVMHHWDEVAQNEPKNLPQIFNERKSTIFENLEYLNNLAQSYSQMQPPVNFTAVNVKQLIENLLKNYESFPDQQIEFETHFDQEELYVQADAVQLRRAFENILRNSIEAIENSGKVLVFSKLEGDQIVITWQDTGSGIPEEIQKKLFKALFTSKEDGTGIGLTNVNRIIKDFSGRIKIESEPGQGTSVIITLPRFRDSTKTSE